eukprot:scaffold3761_cov372-Prasinococcus_capsulatus_cf.AAC.22
MPAPPDAPEAVLHGLGPRIAARVGDARHLPLHWHANPGVPALPPRYCKGNSPHEHIGWLDRDCGLQVMLLSST